MSRTLTLLFALALGASAVMLEGRELAKRVESDLMQRDTYIASGGWALLSQSCDTGTTECGTGSCCPDALFCQGNSAWTASDNLCCPDNSTSCLSAIKAIPFCADPSWVLWLASASDPNTYFCCVQGQIGLNTGKCASGQEDVAATLSASLIGVSLTPGAPSSTIDATAVGGKTTATIKSAEATTTSPGATSTGSGGIGSAIKSAVDGAIHNGGNYVVVEPVFVEVLVGAVVILLL